MAHVREEFALRLIGDVGGFLGLAEQASRLALFGGELSNLNHALLENLDRLAHFPDLVAAFPGIDIGVHVSAREFAHASGHLPNRPGDTEADQPRGGYAEAIEAKETRSVRVTARSISDSALGPRSSCSALIANFICSIWSATFGPILSS